MIPPFQYPDENWRAIEACLAKLAPDADAHVRAHWRHTIEAKVDGYLRSTARYDPRAPEAIEEKACWKKLAVHLQGALDALASLEAIGTQADCILEHTIARHPWDLEPDADFLIWKNQTAAAARLAVRSAKGRSKSARGSNRSRGDGVDRLIGDLLTFWIDCRGRVGKGINSPSTRFIVAAVGRVLSTTVPDVRLPGAVVDFVRVGFRAPKASL